MQENKNNRTKLITLRLKTAEYQEPNRRFKTTTCSKQSDYLRKILLTGKVTVFTRNQSIDDFMAEMINFKKRTECHRKQLQLGSSQAAYFRKNS
jgi:hypothetical protein